MEQDILALCAPAHLKPVRTAVADIAIPRRQQDHTLLARHGLTEERPATEPDAGLSAFRCDDGVACPTHVGCYTVHEYPQHSFIPYSPHSISHSHTTTTPAGDAAGSHLDDWTGPFTSHEMSLISVIDQMTSSSPSHAHQLASTASGHQTFSWPPNTTPRGAIATLKAENLDSPKHEMHSNQDQCDNPSARQTNCSAQQLHQRVQQERPPYPMCVASSPATAGYDQPSGVAGSHTPALDVTTPVAHSSAAHPHKSDRTLFSPRPMMLGGIVTSRPHKQHQHLHRTHPPQLNMSLNNTTAPLLHQADQCPNSPPVRLVPRRVSRTLSGGLFGLGPPLLPPLRTLSLDKGMVHQHHHSTDRNSDISTNTHTEVKPLSMPSTGTSTSPSCCHPPATTSQTAIPTPRHPSASSTYTSSSMPVTTGILRTRVIAHGPPKTGTTHPNFTPPHRPSLHQATITTGTAGLSDAEATGAIAAGGAAGAAQQPDIAAAAAIAAAAVAAAAAASATLRTPEAQPGHSNSTTSQASLTATQPHSSTSTPAVNGWGDTNSTAMLVAAAVASQSKPQRRPRGRATNNRKRWGAAQLHPQQAEVDAIVNAAQARIPPSPAHPPSSCPDPPPHTPHTPAGPPSPPTIPSTSDMPTSPPHTSSPHTKPPASTKPSTNARNVVPRRLSGGVLTAAIRQNVWARAQSSQGTSPPPSKRPRTNKHPTNTSTPTPTPEHQSPANTCDPPSTNPLHTFDTHTTTNTPTLPTGPTPALVAPYTNNTSPAAAPAATNTPAIPTDAPTPTPTPTRIRRTSTKRRHESSPDPSPFATPISPPLPTPHTLTDTAPAPAADPIPPAHACTTTTTDPPPPAASHLERVHSSGPTLKKSSFNSGGIVAGILAEARSLGVRGPLITRPEAVLEAAAAAGTVAALSALSEERIHELIEGCAQVVDIPALDVNEDDREVHAVVQNMAAPNHSHPRQQVHQCVSAGQCPAIVDGHVDRSYWASPSPTPPLLLPSSADRVCGLGASTGHGLWAQGDVRPASAAGAAWAGLGWAGGGHMGCLDGVLDMELVGREVAMGMDRNVMDKVLRDGGYGGYGGGGGGSGGGGGGGNICVPMPDLTHEDLGMIEDLMMRPGYGGGGAGVQGDRYGGGFSDDLVMALGAMVASLPSTPTAAECDEQVMMMSIDDYLN